MSNTETKRLNHLQALREQIRTMGITIKHSPWGPYRDQVMENWIECQALHAAIKAMSIGEYGYWLKLSPQGQQEAIKGILDSVTTTGRDNKATCWDITQQKTLCA